MAEATTSPHLAHVRCAGCEERIDGAQRRGHTAQLRGRHWTRQLLFQCATHLGVDGRVKVIGQNDMCRVVARHARWAHAHAAGGAEAGDELVLPVRGARHRHAHHLRSQVVQEHQNVGMKRGVLAVRRAADGAHECAAGGAVERGRLSRRRTFAILMYGTHVARLPTVGNGEKMFNHVIGNAVLGAAWKAACWAIHERAKVDGCGHADTADRVETIEELGESDGPLAAAA